MADRENVIKGLEDIQKHLDNGYSFAICWKSERIRDALSLLKSQQEEIERLRQPKWTYASEGMPKYECYGKKYWVYTQYRKSFGEVGGRKVELLRWEQTTIRGKTVERFKTLWDAVVYDEVIAWMPLKEPEPPMMD